MPVILKNNTSSTLATAITASDTAIVVADGSQFPALSAGGYFYATLVSTAGTLEIVKVTARVSNSLTVVRAQDGSSAAGFQVGSLVDMRVNAQSVADLPFQPVDPTLTALAGLSTAAGDYIEATGTDAFRMRKLTVATYAALTSIPAASRHDDMLVYVASRATDGDGGEGWWRFNAASSATANGGTILAPDAGTGRWSRNNNNLPTLEQFGGGLGVAASDQTALEAVAALGLHIKMLRGKTYYQTAGVTPITGFGITFEDGAKLVAVTQASGSGSAGFKNYSGAAAARNSTSSTMFMLTASGGRFTFVNPTFEGDNSNQPILRPIYANGSYLYIHGQVTVANMNAANGCLSLDQMLGGFVEDYDLRANADMVDSAYTNLTNYTPTGIMFDDDGTFRSSRMYFGPGVIKGFNRDAGGAAPTESDGITIGGIGKALRSGAVGGHVFGPIYVEDLGEGVDCFQDDCVFESITARSCALFGVKFVHGAQSNVVQWLDVDTYGSAAITFAGSSTTATATRDNVVIDGIVRNGGKIGTGDVSVVLFQENGGTGVARNNYVHLRETVVDSDTDYLIKDNHAGSGFANRVEIKYVTGSLAFSAASVTDLSNATLRVGGGLARLTMSASQTGIASATNTTVLFDTVETDLLSEAVTASNKIRAKYPGRKIVRASIRTTVNADDDVSVRILQDGVVIAQTNDEAVSGASDHTYRVERMVYVNPNQAGTASADFTVQVRITSAGTIDITNTATMSFFELMDVD